MGLSAELKKQIEAAYDFRGHVTVRLKDGSSVEGFLFNRQYDNAKLAEDNFIEVMVKGGGERKRFAFAAIESVALTGEDAAAGKSFADYQKRKASETGGA